MNNVIIIRYNEIHLKGKNRGFFEKLLLKNIAEKIAEFNGVVKKIAGRFIINDFQTTDTNNVVNAISKIFGIDSYSVGYEIKTSVENIYECVSNLNLSRYKSFKVSTRRADKTFAIHSMELSKNLGEFILNKFPNLKVDVIKPECEVIIDIRENGNTYICDNLTKSLGGMPVGSAGKALLLLSGGIDSPVAGYLMAKRGLEVECLHFHSYPYTSELAQDKVAQLAKIISQYCGKIKLHTISLTEIQENIHKHCNKEYMITILRRFMMRIAEHLAIENNLGAIITGESLGQVASQTMESITSTNDVVNTLPIFRPLISFDKNDIIEISHKIGTYNTSIMPYEDCCTVFLPPNPIIKPKISKVINEEEKLNLEELFNNAINSHKIINI